MRIDRAKFLILAAALAPAGCVVTTHDEPVDTNPNASTGSGGSGGGDSPDAATSGSAGSVVADGSAGMSSGGTAADDGGDPAPQADGASSSDSGAGSGGSGGSGGSAGSGGSGGCDDSLGDPPACDMTNVCGNDWAIDTCNSALTYMKPGPAEIYALCVQNCDDPYFCMDATLLGACPDPTTTTDCETIVAGCPSIQQDDCEQYLSGLTQAGRDDMITCAASGGAFCDLYTCSESIGYW